MPAKTVLLTGGNGFIGKNLKESFLAGKYNLLTPGSKDLNLCDEDAVARYFDEHQIDIVVHSAVKPNHRNAKDLNNIFYSNTRMFFNLERYSAQYEKMLVLGSGAIYDLRYYRPLMKEEEYTRFLPADEHGYCKYVCEKVIEKSDNIYDLRLFGIFGKYEDYAIRFISNAICKTLYDLPVTLRQDRRFSYLYVDDLAPVIDYFIENTPRYKAYNIVPDQVVSLYDLAQMVVKISGKDLPVQVAQDGLGLEYSGDNSRLKKEIPDIRFTPIEDSVRQLYEWYVSHCKEIDKNLLLFDK